MSEATSSPDYDAATIGDVLTELQAIRELLERQDTEQALCPHGARGLCMSCVTPQIDYALSNLVREVSTSVREVMRRA